MTIKALDEAATKAALPFPRLIEALDEGFRATVEAPLRHHHTLSNPDAEDDTLLLMPAWTNEEWGGVKIVNVVPGNRSRGLPAISSSYILFDRRTGEHKLLLDGGELTARRTAAASALAASRLARPDSERLLVVGAGRVASNIPLAYRAALPIKSIAVYNRTRAGAERLVDALRKDGFEAEVAADLQTAVAAADIISSATLSREPILEGDWLKPGQHVDLIGSFTPQMREADDRVLQRSRIFVDTDHATVESGELVIPLKSGAIGQGDIAGTLVDLCRTGGHGRTSDEEITLFKSVGSAIEDLSAAIAAFKASDE